MEDHEPQKQVIQCNSESIQQSTHGAQHDHIPQTCIYGRTDKTAKPSQVAQIQLEQGKGRSLLTCHAPLSAPWVASWRRRSARCWNQDGGPFGAARAPPGRGRRGGRGSGLQGHRQPLGARASPHPPPDHRRTHIAWWKPQSYPAQRRTFKELCQHILFETELE